MEWVPVAMSGTALFLIPGVGYFVHSEIAKALAVHRQGTLQVIDEIRQQIEMLGSRITSQIHAMTVETQRDIAIVRERLAVIEHRADRLDKEVDSLREFKHEWVAKNWK